MFLGDFGERRLAGVNLVISDAHAVSQRLLGVQDHLLAYTPIAPVAISGRNEVGSWRKESRCWWLFGSMCPVSSGR